MKYFRNVLPKFLSLKIVAATIALSALCIAPVKSVEAACTPYVFNTNLTMGSRGVAVEHAQKYLVSRGYLQMPANTAFGYFGGVTRAAVVIYQRENALPPTGYFGPMTRASMTVAANGRCLEQYQFIGANPNQPVNPGNPGNPNNPVNPVNPGNPVTPTQPFSLSVAGGASTFAKGSTQNISWNGGEQYAAYYLYLSGPNLSYRKYVGQTSGVSGNISWLISSDIPAGQNYRIEYSGGGLVGGSSQLFTITDTGSTQNPSNPSNPTSTTTAPLAVAIASTSVQTGSVQKISWTGGSEYGGYYVYLNGPNMSYRKYVGYADRLTGSFDWTVTNDLPTGQNYKIEFLGYGIVQASSPVFTITNTQSTGGTGTATTTGALQVSVGNGATSLVGNQYTTIAWSGGKAIDAQYGYSLYLSRPSTGFYQYLTYTNMASGTMSWLVPNLTAATDYKIEFTSSGATKGMSQTFAVTAPVTGQTSTTSPLFGSSGVFITKTSAYDNKTYGANLLTPNSTSPNGVKVGDKLSIGWNSANLDAATKVRLVIVDTRYPISRSGDNISVERLAIIATNQPNAGTYEWTIPATLTDFSGTRTVTFDGGKVYRIGVFQDGNLTFPNNTALSFEDWSDDLIDIYNQAIPGNARK